MLKNSTSSRTGRRLPTLFATLLLALLPLSSAFADNDHDGDDDDKKGSRQQCPAVTTTTTNGQTTTTTPATLATYRLSAMPAGHRAVSEGDSMPAGHVRTPYGGAGTVFSLSTFPDATLVTAGTPATTTTSAATGSATNKQASYRQGKLTLPDLALDDDPKQRFSIELEWVPNSQPPLFRLRQATPVTTP